MKKSLCVIFSVILAFSVFGVNIASAETNTTDIPDFDFKVISSKTEFSADERVEVSISLKNNTPYLIGEIVTWVEYDGNVCLSPVVPEVDMGGGMVSGASFTPSFTLEGKDNSVFMRAVYKALMFITRNFVIIRQRFNNFSDFFNPLALMSRRSKLGTCKIKYDGEDVELSFSVSYVNIKKCPTGETDISFSPISADEVRVSDEDKKLCRDWFMQNIVYAGTDGKIPAYNFNIGGKSFRDNISDWKFSVPFTDKPYGKYRNGKLSEVLFSSDKYDISGRVEAVIYEESATCEWTVYLENSGRNDSGVIKDFNAVDCSFPTGKADLYANMGSPSSADDFTLFRISDEGPCEFGCREGRSSDYYLPYFNLNGSEFSFCLGIGWSGQWECITDLKSDSVSVSAKQETLDAKLVSGEEIRSPLVSLTFYKNPNPLKGFNLFRDWVLNSLLPEDLPEKMLNVDAFFVSPSRTAGEMLCDLKAIPDERYENIDNIWMDAGWYCKGENSIWDDRFGTWKTTENRFPSGIKEIADFGQSRDTGLVLWYEEERLSNTEESELYIEGRKHNDWIIGEDSGDYTTGLIWNFGNPDALGFMEKFISNSLKENGVTVFREDSNFDPLSYWKYGDKHIYGGRNGICENHYVDGHYQFLDYLFADNENLRTYDCCASGGRRLDLEVIRRGVPLWRSDYNCDVHDDILEATQSQTYSLSFWLPFTGTYYYTGNDYRARTTLYQGYQVFCGDMANDAYNDIVKYNPERAMMNGNFYPISFGGTDSDKITAMQYGTSDKGFAVIYKRKNVTGKEFSFSLSGLDADALYEIYDYDAPDSIRTYSGSELMNNILKVPFAEGEQAIIIEYNTAD